MSWRLSGRIALVGFLASLFASGCGSLSQIASGTGAPRAANKSGKAAKGWGKRSHSGQTLSGLKQVGIFTGRFDSRTGQLTIEPETASTRATQYGPRHAVTLTGTATALPGGLLRGAVTLASNNPVEMVDCRVVLLSVSSTGVTAHNPDGTVNLAGTPRPFWTYGTIRAGQPALSRDWEFKNPGGVNFTFRAALFANTWSVTTADGSTLAACSFINANTGWAVGSKGKIFFTSDGGRTWTSQNAGTSADLKDVTFINATHGWAVGAGGTILVTTDGGTSWRIREATTTSSGGFTVPVFANLNAVAFVSATTGVAVGENQTIVRTTDGGNTWQQVGESGSIPLYDISFGSATTGCAVGASATVMRTTDGGASWTTITLPSSTRVQTILSFNILQSVHFINEQQGWAVGASGWVIATSNGGLNWTKKRPTTTQPQPNLNGVFFANANTGWAAQANGAMLVTTDGGDTWNLTPNQPTSLILNGLTGLPGNTSRIWVVGQSGFSAYTTDGGQSWLRPGQAAGATWATTGSNLNALWFLNETTGWAAGSNGTMLRTTDGGKSWRSSIFGIIPGTNLDDVYFVDANNGWSVGATGRIFRSTDGGQNWSPLFWDGLIVEEGQNPPGLSGVRFLDTQRGWVVGSNNTILRTLDGGNSWEMIFPPLFSTTHFSKIGWLNSQRGWIVGSGGVILGTEDGGDTWVELSSGTLENLNQIAVVPAGPSGLTLWVVGARGTLLKSTDGVSWTLVDMGLPFATLQSVAFLPNGQHGWIVGNNGLILRTKDGGDTWTSMDSGAGISTPLRAIFPVTADEVWLAGERGTLRVFR